jgi:hypothetical protein
MTLQAGFSRKCVAALASLGALLLLAPVAALANSCPSTSTTTCVINTDGTPSASGTGTGSVFSLSGSELTQIGWKTGGSYGKLSFSTGAMEAGGSYATTATFSDLNSSFVLKGTYNNISNGIIFNGAFSSPIVWSVIGTCTTGQMCEYDLTGQISGTWYPNSGSAGVTVSGATVQLYFLTSGPYHGGSQAITDVGGISFLNTPTVTAEPASLALMGTGLLGVGFLARRKVKRLPPEA